MAKIKKVLIFTDGACRGNPGPGAIGAIIKDEKDRTIGSLSQVIGQTTSNQAEYRAIIAALEMAIELGAGYVELRSDSELTVRQINGRYRVKEAALKPLHQRVKELQSQLKGVTFTNVPREENEEANRLANMALDSK